MGFSSYDDLIAEMTAGKRYRRSFNKVNLATTGVAGQWFSSWGWTGDPAAGVYTGTTLTSYQCTETNIVGGIPHGGNVTADTKHLIKWGMMCAAATAVPAVLMLVDRLLYYPLIDMMSVANQQLINNVALPRYTDGVGVRAWLEITQAPGTGTGVFTFGTQGYTNTVPTSGRQHGVTVNTVASAAIARIPHSGQIANQNWNPFLPMQAGDLGVKSVEAVQFTSAHASTGQCALVLGKELATLPLPAVNVFTERDFIFQVASLVQIYDGACLHFLVFEPGALVASTPYYGDLEFAWG
jgi:hypothetical protein